jgi:light-regulated signal transduction histidine kinase (bacteriophytochrome)
MELEQRNVALVAANTDLESFANSISHDLRTPLRHIHCYMELLEESAGTKLSGWLMCVA